MKEVGPWWLVGLRLISELWPYRPSNRYPRRTHLASWLQTVLCDTMFQSLTCQSFFRGFHAWWSQGTTMGLRPCSYIVPPTLKEPWIPRDSENQSLSPHLYFLMKRLFSGGVFNHSPTIFLPSPNIPLPICSDLPYCITHSIKPNPLSASNSDSFMVCTPPLAFSINIWCGCLSQCKWSAFQQGY